MTALIAAAGLPIGILMLILGFIMSYAGAMLTHPLDNARKMHGLWYGLACIVGGYVVLALSRMI